jgi:LAO/AO transport system kinase
VVNESAPLAPPIARLAPADIAARIAERHIRTVSRAITWIENGDPAIRSVVDSLIGRAGKTLVVGVTGVPGAGKSTLVPALARHFAGQGKHVAILAVDPSSPLTGGAILGDRIRDTALGETNIFFRSVASRGSLGGLSRTLDDVVTLLEVAGFDVVLIETVGTGQSEIAVTRLAHTTLMVTAPGLGDEIQAMKAGILELAELVVVNKADSDPRGAEATAMTLRQAISEAQRFHGFKEGANGAVGGDQVWLPPVRAVSALGGQGLPELAALILAHREMLAASDRLERWRRKRLEVRFAEALRDAFIDRLTRDFAAEHASALAAVAAGESSPIREAEELVERVMNARPTTENQGRNSE